MSLAGTQRRSDTVSFIVQLYSRGMDGFFCFFADAGMIA
jgi:hypothetical protein